MGQDRQELILAAVSLLKSHLCLHTIIKIDEHCYPSINLTEGIRCRRVHGSDPPRTTTAEYHLLLVGDSLTSQNPDDIRLQVIKRLTADDVYDRTPYDLVVRPSHQVHERPIDPEVLQVTTSPSDRRSHRDR